MTTPPSWRAPTTSSLNPSGATAIGMAANTSMGGTGTCEADRHSSHSRRCSATRRTMLASNRDSPATCSRSVSWAGAPWRHTMRARTTVP